MVHNVTFAPEVILKDNEEKQQEALLEDGIETRDVSLDLTATSPSESAERDRERTKNMEISLEVPANAGTNRASTPFNLNLSAENLAQLSSQPGFSRRASHAGLVSLGGTKRPRSVYSMRESIPVVREKKELRDMNRTRDFYTKSVSAVAEQMGVDIKNGLKAEDIQLRKKAFGENQLKKEKGVSAIRLFLHHLVGTLNFILVVAAVASVVAAILENSFDWIEGVLIMVIIVLNTSIGFVQEYRSAKTMQSLMKMFAPEADVLRDGRRQQIPAKTLVPGDIVHLEDGDFVPADLRLIEAVQLNIDEAFLTGESDPVSKTTGSLKAEEAKALGDRSNLAYMSSVVTSGRGKGIVVRTGEDTELGEIAKKLRSSKDNKKTELQKTMKKLGFLLFLTAIVFSCIALAIQVLAIGTDAFKDRGTWLYLVALCVAVIPEGLPCVLALTLALGMRTMAKKNAIVRKLGVLESLNWITDICSDKTGTLTEGKMVATAIYSEEKHFKVTGTGIIPEGNITDRSGAPVPTSSLSEDRALTHFLRACSLCNMATLTQVNDEWQATSSPTEIALQVLAHKVGMGKPTLEKNYQFMGEHPFDSHWKRMSVVYKKSDEPIQDADEVETVAPEDTIVFLKGSVEAVLSCCNKMHIGQSIIDLTDAKKKLIIEQVEKMASRGLRVLAFSMKENFKFSIKQIRQATDENCTFLGLAGIMDPPRVQSKPAVEKAHKAGISVYMLTGDHKKTATNIAKQVGIVKSDLHDRVMIGSEFETMKVIGNDFPKVIARCNPDTKIKMIDELHSRDRFVVMTGDGVNDAPAIKRSDVGVAMGIGGSEVTKDSADILLMDDNFGTIIVAIEEGRRIYANICKIVLFLMVSNVGELIILVLGLCVNFFSKDADGKAIFPLTPMQILWLNVITDTPICIALGLEPVSEDVMQQKPKSRKEGFFSLEINIDTFIYGGAIGLLSLANFVITFFTAENRDATEKIDGKDIQTALYQSRAVAFVTIAYCMLFHGFNALHPRNSLLLHKFERKLIIGTVVFGALSVLLTIYIPFVNVYIFKQYRLDWQHWVQITTAVVLFATGSEIYKLLKKVVISLLKNGRYAISLAERVANAMDNIDAKLGSNTPEEEEQI